MLHKLAHLLILAGISLFVFTTAVTFYRNNPNRLKFDSVDAALNSYKNLSEDPDELAPVFINISQVDIRLPVIPAKDPKNGWHTTNKGVSYLDSSAPPGETGNSIFYGHNWGSLLANLRYVKPGYLVEIALSDGSKKNFEVQKIQEVSADQTSVLKNTDDKRITIYTCSGLFDRKRLVVSAFLKE